MTEAEENKLLERFDLTDPAIQRKTVLRFAEKMMLYKLALEDMIEQLDRWAAESQTGGWSTHQVDPMRHKAYELRRLLGSSAKP